MRCKGNFVKNVNKNMPLMNQAITDFFEIYCYISINISVFLFDKYWLCGIIIETFDQSFYGDRGARQKRKQASQGPGPCRRGHAKSDAWEDPGPQVPRRRVLRSARHRAGQIRDATPCVRGERIGDQCDRGIWRIEADVLPDQSQLRGSGDRWVGAQEARPARPTQGKGGGARVYPGETGRGRTYSRTPIGRSDPGKIRSRYSPKNDRACDCSKKNATLKPDGGGSLDRLTDIVSEYEALRNAAFGHTLPVEARSGLMLFLRRGMWGWARVLAMPGTSSLQPRRDVLSSFPTAEESRAAVYIFATMAMSTEHRGPGL